MSDLSERRREYFSAAPKHDLRYHTGFAASDLMPEGVDYAYD
jgi:hypothetical protein